MNENPNAFQSELSSPVAVAADAAPPLQFPCVQRDCRPHRGKLLWSLGMSAMALGGLSIAFFPLVVLAAPLGLTAWFLARYDLAKIRDGVMDPNGERLAYEALNESSAGLVLTCASLVLWGGMLLCMRP
jgi:hypothetical protein